jgi:SnoaL-like protein
MVDRLAFGAWLGNYERAWRTEGTAGLRELFTADATYRASPYAEPVVGLGAIARFWEAERDAPDEVFTMTTEIVAVDGDTGVARLEVRYGDPVRQEFRDLWVVGFAPDGRCATFEEWWFEPPKRGQ